jgi:hypothetical protein
MTRILNGLTRLAVAAALALAASGALAQGVTTQTVSGGAAGSLYGRDAARAVFVYVTQRPSSTGAVEVEVFFDVYEASPTAQGGLTNVLFGSGTVPAADLRSDGLGQLALDTNTSGNAGFTTWACPNPLPATPPYCTPTANPGRIQLALARAGGAPVSHQDGQWTSDYGTIRVTQTGSAEWAPATGAGAVGAVAVPVGATGSIEISHDVFVVVEQK